MITPVILCGGMGTRLWPLSRESNPKQFLTIAHDLSLLQLTAERVKDSTIFTKPIIVCNAAHKFKIASQLEEIGIEPMAIILEPVSKNTAPAIALAAHYLQQHAPDSTMLVMPADHMIKDAKSFCQIISSGQKYAKQNLITFAITPDNPSTAYGYIEQGECVEGDCYKIKQFREKPNKYTAEQLIKDGAKWNSGIFLFDASIYLQELEKLQPEICRDTGLAVKHAEIKYNFIEAASEHFAKCKDISVDYAVFEHSRSTLVITMNINWSDIGSWKALFDYNDHDNDGNYSFGTNYLHQTSNCLVYTQPGMSVATYGVENLCVVTTKDAVLVVNKDDSEMVKTIVQDLKTKNLSLIQSDFTYYRPWGYYQNLLEDGSYKVKKLSIAPGNKISLQYHHQRSEHWVVSKGVAMVTHGEKSYRLERGESTYIPVGTVHRLENIGTEPLEIVEVQIGDYLEEDDIVRLEDKYGRS